MMEFEEKPGTTTKSELQDEFSYEMFLSRRNRERGRTLEMQAESLVDGQDHGHDSNCAH
jgi:hypothetical protein